MLSVKWKSLLSVLVVAAALAEPAESGLVKRAKKDLDVGGDTKAVAGTQIVLDTIFSTAWNYSTVGGADPNLVKYQKVSIPFVQGDFPEKSINLTNGDAIIGIDVHDNRALQQMIGAGCGITDSASIALQAVKQANPDQYDELMRTFFDQSPEWAIEKGGAGLNIVRSPIGASDFATSVYSYDDTADDSPDTSLSLFTIDRAPKMWQTHMDIQKTNARVKRMWAPWSPPGWMKYNGTVGSGQMIGGQLQPKYYDVYAKYLARSMQAIKQKLGSSPWQLSIQNEPMYLPDKYPGNKINATDAATIGGYTRQYLDNYGLKDVTLTAYDHNWDHAEYPTKVFDSTKAFDSVSWHCYGGDPSAQDDFNKAFPGCTTIMSECTRITQNNEEPWSNLRKSASQFLTEAIEHGTQAVVLWNCALTVDENGFTTPHLPNVCSNCAAPALLPQAMTGNAKIQSQTQPPSRRSGVTTDKSKASGKGPFGTHILPAYVPPGGPIDTHGKFRLTSDFSVLAHLSRAIRPRNREEQWAVRVGASTTEEANDFPDGERIKVQAYRTSIGSDGKRRWSLTLLQKHDHFLSGVYNDVTATIKFRGMVANVTLPVGLHTLTWVA